MRSVRITSGKYRGREIVVPEVAHAMGAREKLALFNMVEVKGLGVLDIFAGSGALGIEAISRGAASVVFVERDKKAASVIKGNLERLGIIAEVICEKAGKFHQGKYDVILVDPPYDKFEMTEISHLSELLKDDGVLVLSHPQIDNIALPGLELMKTKRYAGAAISIFSRA